MAQTQYADNTFNIDEDTPLETYQNLTNNMSVCYDGFVTKWGDLREVLEARNMPLTNAVSVIKATIARRFHFTEEQIQKAAAEVANNKRNMPT